MTSHRDNIVVVQQKCLDGGALVGEGSEVDFESIPFAKQNGNVVVVDIHNVIGRKQESRH